ncbi:hypothetical protein CANARDRAFT_193664 [[Candida] arabinofermentans NRRL YB-2248]|uniref:Cytochrome P450 n=1 Tax=[Candida] arabinofermentans NRRL YB-2248 TaxID=983967 RepID=A0A1E4T7M0_9ASCO|nr:hypothetical protein CANARDRAFT_193664 [[Candida] arabinofermentans NRRL YB-2248]
MDVTKESQYFHLAVALRITYGYKLDVTNNTADKDLAEEMIFVENYITKIRSHVQNVQDYLPRFFRIIFNYFNNISEVSLDLYQRREKYLSNLFCFTKHRLDLDDQDIQGAMMYDYCKSTNKDDISERQITSICLTMVSAGLDNTPLNFQYAMSQFSQSPSIYKKARQELLDCYDNDPIKCWKECHTSMKCDYIVAVVKETLRLFTVLPMSLPRATTKDIIYQDAVIPKGTTLFMNAWAGNHDPKRFLKPMEFIPERFLDLKTNKLDNSLKHFSFGIGARMCLGNNLAFKELYILICKFILMFKISASNEVVAHCSSLNPLEINMFPFSIAIEPRPYKTRYSIQDSALVEMLLNESEPASSASATVN